MKDDRAEVEKKTERFFMQIYHVYLVKKEIYRIYQEDITRIKIVKCHSKKEFP